MSLFQALVWALLEGVTELFAVSSLGHIFFFQAEDGIRDYKVTGVQTCALPILGLFYEPIARLHGLNQMIQAARAAGERVFDILDAPIERANGMPRHPLREPVRGEVIYENVGFSYNPDRVVLRNISLHARPGEM